MFRTTAATLMTLVATQAAAVTITETYDFTTGGTGAGTSVATFTSDRGNSVSVTAGIYDLYPTARIEGIGEVTLQDAGVGQFVECGTCGDTPLLDGNGQESNPRAAGLDTDPDTAGNQLGAGAFAEILTFDFEKAVTLGRITFASYDDSDPKGTLFDLVVGDSAYYDLDFGSDGIFDPAGFFTATSFAIGAYNCITGFAVASITVSYEGENPPPPIPLPAGAVLLLTGLGGLAIARRRRG